MDERLRQKMIHLGSIPDRIHLIELSFPFQSHILPLLKSLTDSPYLPFHKLPTVGYSLMKTSWPNHHLKLITPVLLSIPPQTLFTRKGTKPCHSTETNNFRHSIQVTGQHYKLSDIHLST